MARILIAEDEEGLRSLVARALMLDGHDVITANDGAEALELIVRTQGAFDLLLTDIVIDWHGLPVTDIYPQKLPDLFSGKPLVVSGRYLAPVSGNIRLKGKRAGEEFVR